MFDSLRNFRKGKKVGNSYTISRAPSFCNREIHDPLYQCCTSGLWALDNVMPNRKTCALPKMKSNQFFLNLRDKFDGLKLGEKFDQLYSRASEHDKRIVNRMAMKRTQEIQKAEDSFLARRFWDEERTSRKLIMQDDNEMLMRMLKERRERESQDTMMRLENLRNRDKYFTAKLKEELDAKEFRVHCRLAKLQHYREIQQNERKQFQMEKASMIQFHNEETDLDKKLQQQWIINNLEEKIRRADQIRKKYIQAQKFRLQFDNEMEQKIHSAKFQEIQRFEHFQKERLLDSIRRNEKKAVEFLEHKRVEVERSRSQAKESRDLRDFIRRSITPDVHNTMGMLTTRSFLSV